MPLPWLTLDRLERLVDFDCYALEYRKIPRKIYAGVIAREIESHAVDYLVNSPLLDPRANETAHRIMRTFRVSEDFHAELERISSRFDGQWAVEEIGRDSAESGEWMTARLRKAWLDEREEEAAVGEKPKLSRRKLLLDKAKSAFGMAAERMTFNMPMRVFTYPKNKMTIDYAFAVNSDLRMFHVVSMTANLDQAFVLAQRYKRIRDGAYDKGRYQTKLTAVVEDQLDYKDDSISEAVEALYSSEITVRPVSELTKVAKECPYHQKLELYPPTRIDPPGNKISAASVY
jgi:hypothetical protein